MIRTAPCSVGLPIWHPRLLHRSSLGSTRVPPGTIEHPFGCELGVRYTPTSPHIASKPLQSDPTHWNREPFRERDFSQTGVTDPSKSCTKLRPKGFQTVCRFYPKHARNYIQTRPDGCKASPNGQLIFFPSCNVTVPKLFPDRPLDSCSIFQMYSKQP